jgi:predicted metal-dependent hydrolase
VQHQRGRCTKLAIQYVEGGEMTHYFERNHGERFTQLMDKHLPDRRTRRDQLNDAPLADEKWSG